MPSKYFYACFRSNLLKLFHVDTLHVLKYSKTKKLYLFNLTAQRRKRASIGRIFSWKFIERGITIENEIERGWSGTQLEGARRWYQPTGEANFDVYIAHEQGGIQFYRFRIVRWNRSLVTRPVHTRAPPHEDKGASVPNCNLQIRVLFMIYKDAERG